MKKVFLHVGTGKTGSSSVQKSLRKGAKHLSKVGILYPQYGHRTNHEELNVVFRGGPGPRAIKGRYIGAEESLEAYQSRLLQQFESELASKSSLIYSAEHLFTLSAGHLSQLKALLDKHGVGQVKVLLYFREPVSYYASQVQQRLKGSSRLVDPNDYRPKYCSILARWQAVFDDVEVREFDRAALVNGDVVDDVLAVASEFFSAPELLDLPKSEPVNESLMLETMALLQAFRRHCCADKDGTFTPNTKHLLEHINALEFDYTKPKVRPEVVQVICANNRESVAKLRDMLGYELFKESFVEAGIPAQPPEVPAVNVSDVFVTPADFHNRMTALSAQLLGRLIG